MVYYPGYRQSAHCHPTVKIDDMDVPECVLCGAKTANIIDGRISICTTCENG